MNFNEIFRKDVAYVYIKSHKKTRFHPLFRRYIFRKTAKGSNLAPSHLGVNTEIAEIEKKISKVNQVAKRTEIAIQVTKTDKKKTI